MPILHDRLRHYTVKIYFLKYYFSGSSPAHPAISSIYRSCIHHVQASIIVFEKVLTQTMCNFIRIFSTIPSTFKLNKIQINSSF